MHSSDVNFRHVSRVYFICDAGKNRTSVALRGRVAGSEKPYCFVTFQLNSWRETPLLKSPRSLFPDSLPASVSRNKHECQHPKDPLPWSILRLLHEPQLCSACADAQLLVRLIVPTYLSALRVCVFVRLTRWLLFPLLTPWCSVFLNTVHKSSQSACFWPRVAPPPFWALQPHPLCSDWLPTMGRPHPLWGEDKEVQNSWIKGPLIEECPEMHKFRSSNKLVSNE